MRKNSNDADMKNFTLLFITAMAATVLTCSCGNPGRSEASEKVQPEVADTNQTEITKAYIKGREEARCILDSCGNETELRNMLLQTNARVHILRSKGGDSMADDFLRGFRDELYESGDTLGTTLFPN